MGDKAIGWIKKGTEQYEAVQREQIEGYCKAHGLTVVDWLTGERFDEVAYGTGWASSRLIKAVVVARKTCVSDNEYEWYAYKCKMRLRNSDLESSAEGERYIGSRISDPVLSEFIRVYCDMEVRHADVQIGMKRRQKQSIGGYIGGTAPIGYRVVNGKLEVNAEEAAAVRFCFEQKRSGNTQLGTVMAMEKAGYVSRKGKPYSLSTVHHMWTNEEFYMGYKKYWQDDTWVKGEHEGIIPDTRS